MAARVSSPVLVGRVDELGLLNGLLDRAGPGEVGLVLLGGDAGIGKTRLLGDFAARAREAGRPVLMGGCLDLGEGSVPYAPLVEALRGLVRHGDRRAPAAVLSAGAEELGRLVPDLVPDLARPSLDQGEGSQARLFGALVRLLESLGSEGPAVLVLEDLHWADGSTRELLTYLARTTREGRSLVVGTYRTDEMHRTHPFRRLLHELTRLPVVAHVELAPFGRVELAEQIQLITGEAPDPATVERVFLRSEGNPFYAEELLAADGALGGPLPENLRDLLVDRVAALPDDGQEVLRVASAFGRDVDDAGLAAVWDGDADALVAGLRAALGSRLLVQADSEDGYRFRHALVQEAVYGELLPTERRRVHRAIAEALSSDVGAPRAGRSAELASHWYAAGDHERALVAASAAAADAEDVSAFAEARHHHERVLELWDQVRDPAGLIGADRHEVLLRAANACYLNASMSRALGHVRVALDELGSEPDPVRAAVLHARRSRYLWVVGDGEGALAAAQQAVALMPTDPPTRELAWMLAEYSRLLMLTDAWEASLEPGRRAVEVARAVGARAEEGQALNSLGCSLALLGDHAGGIAHLRSALEIAHEVNRAEDMDRAYINLNSMLMHAERFEEAVEVGLRGLHHLEQLGGPWPMDAFLGMNIVENLYFLGRWDEAEELIERLPEPHGQTVTTLHYLMGRAHIAMVRGRLDDARRDLAAADQMASGVLDSQFRGPLLDNLAEIDVWEGRWDDADARVDASIALMLGNDNERFLLGPLATGLRGVADRAAAARDTGQRDAALSRGRELIELARRLAAEQIASEPGAQRWPAELALCEAEFARLEGDGDPAGWLDVADRWEERGMSDVRAYALFRAAEAAIGSGDRAAAKEALATAHAVASRLGAGNLLGLIADLARRARIDVGIPDADVDAEDGGPLGVLTPREREVLELVAQGLTNRAIAERLFISEKTASVHVSNILAKLGVSSRTEAAAVAHRQGFADLSPA